MQPHKCSLIQIPIGVNSHLHILHLITCTHINTRNDKLMHECPHISYTRNTHAKLTDAQDANLHTPSHAHSQNQHIGIHIDFHTCTCMHTFVSRCIHNQSQT